MLWRASNFPPQSLTSLLSPWWWICWHFGPDCQNIGRCCKSKALTCSFACWHMRLLTCRRWQLASGCRAGEERDACRGNIRWCGSSLSDWFWPAELMNICREETSSAPLPPSHLCPAHQLPTVLRVSFHFWTRHWGFLCFQDLPWLLVPFKTPQSHPRSKWTEARE